MSELGVKGFLAERETALNVFRSLSDADWDRQSDCAGWRVRDVLAHLASTMHGIVDPSFMPTGDDPDIEKNREGAVDERRAWSVAQVLEEWETYSAQAADQFAVFQSPGMAEAALPMGALGTHSFGILPDIFTFDILCHLRNDILAPNGPIKRDLPAADAARLKPTMDWMLAGLPWMCAAGLAVVDRPLVLRLTGPGGGEFTLAPGGEDGRITITLGAVATAAATVDSTTDAFVVWGTTRRPWQDYCTVTGDADYAAAVLNVVNVI